MSHLTIGDSEQWITFDATREAFDYWTTEDEAVEYARKHIANAQGNREIYVLQVKHRMRCRELYRYERDEKRFE